MRKRPCGVQSKLRDDSTIPLWQRAQLMRYCSGPPQIGGQGAPATSEHKVAHPAGHKMADGMLCERRRNQLTRKLQTRQNACSGKSQERTLMQRAGFHRRPRMFVGSSTCLSKAWCWREPLSLFAYHTKRRSAKCLRNKSNTRSSGNACQSSINVANGASGCEEEARRFTIGCTDCAAWVTQSAYSMLTVAQRDADRRPRQSHCRPPTPSPTRLVEAG